MKLTRTVKIKLNIDSNEIKPTISAYTEVFNYVCKVGWQDADTNGVSLHHKTYYKIKENSPLPSQLICSARIKATEALKAVKKQKKKQKVKCPQSKQCSIRYDARSYNVWFDRNQISISTIDGRKKIPITVPEYFRQYLTWKRATAELFIKKNKMFIHIVFEKEITDPPPTDKFIGIDRGINKLVVTSDRQFFNGGKIKRVSNQYRNMRKTLQSCGSKSAKRHLQKISKKENRFRRDVNHRISKTIISSLPPGTTIILEDLKSIRQQARMRKKQRRDLHNWNFYQLEQFITYKAQAKGIKVEYVDSRYTSQKCSRCGYISHSNRQFQSSFKCLQCGFSLNADLNAARNIRQNYLEAISYPGKAAVNQPIVDSSKEESYKPSTLVEGS